MIAIATSTRADWGLLTPLAAKLREDNIPIEILATNMHLLPELGMTVNEISACAYDPVSLPTAGENPDATFANTAIHFGRWFEENKPSALIILGDRYEMLSVASVALLHTIPIIHIAGGTVSEGAFDNAIRNAISQLASLHLAETDRCGRRLINMGINADDIAITGALGVWNAMNVPLMDRDELEESLNRRLPQNFFVGTLHTATLDTMTPETQMAEFINALQRFFDSADDYGAILTYPNNDTDPHPLIVQLKDLEKRYPQRTVVLPSLGMRRYLSAVKLSCGVIGNSSSGVVEVPSLGVPTLDIGVRQKGRECADSVIHCEHDSVSVFYGLQQITSDKMRNLAARCQNPYFKPDTPRAMADIIRDKFKFN